MPPCYLHVVSHFLILSSSSPSSASHTSFLMGVGSRETSWGQLEHLLLAGTHAHVIPCGLTATLADCWASHKVKTPTKILDLSQVAENWREKLDKKLWRKNLKKIKKRFFRQFLKNLLTPFFAICFFRFDRKYFLLIFFNLSHFCHCLYKHVQRRTQRLMI